MKPYYTKLDDGSVIVEWVSPDVRFGINIELNPEESGWFYVTKDMSKNECGLLPPELQRLLILRAADMGYCACKVSFTEKNEAGAWICNKCHRPSR